MTMKKQAEMISEAINAPVAKDPPIDPRRLLSTGSTLANLALSGHARGGIYPGTANLFVGDSSSGKTWFAHSILAEATINHRFDEYQLVYDDVENGALMEVARYFGPELARRKEPARGYDEEGNPRNSTTIESMYFNLYTRLKQGPVIYITDSMDALTSEAEGKKFQDRYKASEKSPEALARLTGTMTDGKAKVNSAHLRQVNGMLKATGSILIMISQTRDNVDAFSMEKKTYSGGRAMKFYSGAEIWTKRVKTLKRTKGDQELQIGSIVEVHVKKNRLSGKEWKVQVPLYFSSGLDETGSMVDYLVSVKRWAGAEKGGSINATDLELKGTREALVKKIEDGGRVKELRMLVAEVWKEIEDEFAIERKPRYGQ